MFEMTTCHLNYFRLWHNGTFFCHILCVKNGSGEKGNGDIGTTMKIKTKATNLFLSTALTCLLGWGNRCLYVCEN